MQTYVHFVKARTSSLTQPINRRLTGGDWGPSCTSLLEPILSDFLDASADAYSLDVICLTTHVNLTLNRPFKAKKNCCCGLILTLNISRGFREIPTPWRPVTLKKTGKLHTHIQSFRKHPLVVDLFNGKLMR